MGAIVSSRAQRPRASDPRGTAPYFFTPPVLIPKIEYSGQKFSVAVSNGTKPITARYRIEPSNTNHSESRPSPNGFHGQSSRQLGDARSIALPTAKV